MSAELSFTKGKRIAKIIDSKNESENGTEIYLYQPDFKCCLECSPKCNMKKLCCKTCSKMSYHLKEHTTNNNKQNEIMTMDQIAKLIKMLNEDNDDDSVNEFLENEASAGAGLKGSNVSKSKVVLKSGRWQIVPNSVYGDPHAVMICGRSGSGKSFWLAEYLMQFVKYYPKYRIYLLSQKTEDKLLDKIPNLKRIPLESLPDAEFEAEDFKESMFVADDVDVISDKRVDKACFDLINKVLEVGRSYNTYSCITMHLSANGNQTKRLLQRATHFVFFKNSSNHGTEYVLNEYFGFDTKELRAIQKIESRSICVIRDCPQIIVSNDTIQFQNQLVKE